MASTNFVLMDSTGTNVEDDATWATDVFRTDGATAGGTCPSPGFNKALFQVSMFVTAMATMLQAKGYSTSDGNPPVVDPATALANLAGVLANILTNADGPPAVPLGSLLSAISPTWNFASAPWSSYNVSAAGGNFVGTLPAANALGGAIVIVTKVDATGNTVSIAPHGTDTISGSGSDKVISSQFSNYWFQSDGITNWTVIAKI